MELYVLGIMIQISMAAKRRCGSDTKSQQFVLVDISREESKFMKNLNGKRVLHKKYSTPHTNDNPFTNAMQYAVKGPEF